MFRVKICGITRAEDAQAAAAAGADAIGLNFYSGSKRYVDPGEAEKVTAVLPPGVRKVGVFVNSPLDEIQSIAAQVGLDAIQLHGDEPPDMVSDLGPQRTIRALRLNETGTAAVEQFLQACGEAVPTAVLVDAFIAGTYGGTGAKVDWLALAPPRPWIGDCPLILAGGLTAENVAEAIRVARPDGVDTASGVEVEGQPGVKNPKSMAAFITAARAALGLD